MLLIEENSVTLLAYPLEIILGMVMIFSSLGVILAKKPVHSCLYFFLTLMTLATTYLQLSAEFIGVMQILIYAGAILVIFMFVMVLFQDAHEKISITPGGSAIWLLVLAALSFLIALIVFGIDIKKMAEIGQTSSVDFGSVQALGQLLYVDFFFPFEGIILLFLIASIGALYIGKKED